MTGVRVEQSINCGILQVLVCLHDRVSQRWQDSVNFSRAENNLRAHTEPSGQQDAWIADQALT